MIWNRRQKDVEGSQTTKGEYDQKFGMQIRNGPIRPTSTVTGGLTIPSSLSTVEEHFKLNLQNGIDPQNPANPHLWTYNIPVLNANEKKLALEITSGQLVILDIPSNDFPNEMYLFCDTVGGYLDNHGDPTNVIAIFRIRQLIPCVISNVLTYTVIYSCMDTTTWDLGTARVLNFTFGDAQGAYTPPLAQQVSVEAKITHIAY